MNKQIKDIIEKIKQPKTLIIIGISGIVLIFASSFFSGNKKTQTNSSPSPTITAQEYKENLERSVKDTVITITGSENVSVMITLESGIKYSYADVNEDSTDQKTENERESKSRDTKQSYITVKSADGGEEALIVAEYMPQIKGVAIICEGGDNEIIKEKIESAVMAALDITSKRVYIAGGSIKWKKVKF